MTRSSSSGKKPLYKRVLKLLAVFALILLILTAILLWIAGETAPWVAAKVIHSKAGAELTVGENHNNLLVGKIHMKDIRLTNPPEYTEKSCLHINEIKVRTAPWTLLGSTFIINEITVDTKDFALVSKDVNPFTILLNNNIMDLKNAFASPKDDKPEEKKEKEPDTAEPFRFKIEKMVLKLDRARFIIGDCETGGSALADQSDFMTLEFEDITDENITEKVFTKLHSIFAQLGIGAIGSVTGQAEKELGALTNSAGETLNKAGETLGNTFRGIFGGSSEKKSEEKAEEKTEAKKEQK